MSSCNVNQSILSANKQWSNLGVFRVSSKPLSKKMYRGMIVTESWAEYVVNVPCSLGSKPLSHHSFPICLRLLWRKQISHTVFWCKYTFLKHFRNYYHPDAHIDYPFSQGQRRNNLCGLCIDPCFWLACGSLLGKGSCKRISDHNLCLIMSYFLFCSVNFIGEFFLNVNH